MSNSILTTKGDLEFLRDLESIEKQAGNHEDAKLFKDSLLTLYSQLKEFEQATEGKEELLGVLSESLIDHYQHTLFLVDSLSRKYQKLAYYLYLDKQLAEQRDLIMDEFNNLFVVAGYEDFGELDKLRLKVDELVEDKVNVVDEVFGDE